MIGSYTVHYIVNDGGVIDRAFDFTGTTVAALVPAGDAGYSIFPATITDAGTFSIAGVPNGDFYLRVGTDYFANPGRAVTIERFELGRPDVTAADIDTELLPDLSGLRPWQADDDLQLASWNAGIGYFSAVLGGQVSGAPATGATTYSGATLSTYGYNLVQHSRGDDLTFLQLVSHPDAGTPYMAAERAFSANVEMVQGLSTMITGAFTALPLSPIHLDIRATQFEAMAAAVNPASASDGTRFYVSAAPGGLSHGLFGGGWPDLLYFDLPPGSPDRVVDAGYGNPFPPGWVPFASVVTTFSFDYSAPLADGGLATPTLLWANLSIDDTVASLSSGPVTPTISPVRNLRVNGLDAFVPRLGLGDAPVVSWDAPVMGTVGRYVVRVSVFFASPGGSTRTSHVLAMILPPGLTSVKLPQGALQAGKHYQVVLTASTDPFNPERPRSRSFPEAAAQAMSAILGP